MPLALTRAAALAALAAGLLFVRAPALGAATGPQLPDLDQETPGQLTVLPSGARMHRHWLLGFSSAVSNVGGGPLTIDGHRPDGGTPALTADQVISGGLAPQVVPGVGQLRYVHSPDHEHWHLMHFERYELRRAGSTRAVVRDRKSGFCLGDRYRVQVPLPGAPPQPVITGRCGLRQPGLLNISEGISVGYGDVYYAYLEYQDLPLDGLRNGRYVLVHSVDVDGRLREASKSNNSASLLLDVRWRHGSPQVRQLHSCPDTARCDTRRKALVHGAASRPRV